MTLSRRVPDGCRPPAGRPNSYEESDLHQTGRHGEPTRRHTGYVIRAPHLSDRGRVATVIDERRLTFRSETFRLLGVSLRRDAHGVRRSVLLVSKYLVSV